MDRNRWPESPEYAINILIQDELFHFLSDYVSAQWEILLQAPCWMALRNALLNSSPNYSEVEEKLANAYMIRSLQGGWSRSLQKCIINFINQQPAGYRDALNCIDDFRFKSELMELTKTYIGLHAVERGLNVFSDLFDYSVLFPDGRSIGENTCPIWIIHDEKSMQIPLVSFHFLQCISNITETEGFQRQLSKCDSSIRQRWEKKKIALGQSIQRGSGFEELRGGRKGNYSVRLNKNYRVHLRPIDSYSRWEAIDIGTHKEMGHG